LAFEKRDQSQGTGLGKLKSKSRVGELKGRYLPDWQVKQALHSTERPIAGLDALEYARQARVSKAYSGSFIYPSQMVSTSFRKTTEPKESLAVFLCMVLMLMLLDHHTCDMNDLERVIWSVN